MGRFTLAILVALPLLCVASLPTPAFAQAVTNIIIEGNQRVEPDTVTAYLQVQPGEVATPDRIDESIKALFQTGLFSDVQIFRRGSSLVVRVEENPIINRVNFEGNDELNDKALTKEVELKERMIFTRARVQSDVQRLVALYRRSGLFAARIEPKIIRLPQNRVDLVFEIDEGAKTRIETINFVGNEAFSDSTLRSAINTSTSAWWKFFSSTDNYDPDRLAYDRELLRRYYLKSGFADFRVISATAELAPDGESFYITFTVEEGPQYDLADITVNAGETTLDPNVLQDALTVHKGQRYDATKLDKSVENLTIEAGKSGYAFARIEPQIDRNIEGRTLNVTFNIQEGPRVYIERIDIVGNTRTLDYVIRRELRLVEGDAYNRVLVDRARRRLTALDFFEKIDIQETQGSASDKVLITIAVVEKSTGTINFAAGYSTVEQVIGSVSITERNLMGRGQYVRLSTALSFKRQSIDFSFTEPYFLDRNVAAGFDAYATRTDQTSESSFRTQQFGGALRTGFYLSDTMRLNTKYGFTHRIIDIRNNINKISPAIRQAEGSDNISLASVGFVYDDLDNPLKPTSGFRVEANETIAGLGGDVYYFKSELDAYYFMPLLFEGVVLKVKGSAGHVQGWMGEDVPIIDRFYKGADSFRGFARAGVGARMSNGMNFAGGDPEKYREDAIGGQTFAIGTLEVTFPLGLPAEFGVEGAVFTDFGTVFNVPENDIPANTGLCLGSQTCKVFDSVSPRVSVGAGVIWQSPFGPLRVDVAYPLVKEDFDETELVRFSVGTRF
ncbi:MAG: outer membrane protein assembly factor BamA [Parvibaculaceae bacterium]